jgi:large subunit ribosomal protein L25
MWRAWRSVDSVYAGDLVLPSGVTLVAEPEALVLHVLAAPTAEQIEAELGEVPEVEEAPEEVPGAVAEAAPSADEQPAG